MKSKILYFILLASISTNCYSQAKFGVKGGVNFTTVKFNYTANDKIREPTDKMRARLNLGVLLEIPLSSSFFFRPELQYSGKGVAIDIQEDNNAAKDDFQRYSLDYLELPINFVFNKGGFELFAGPYISTAINGNEAEEYRGRYEFTRLKFDDKIEIFPYSNNDYSRYISRTDIGFQIGFGISVDDFIISSSFSNGLLNLIPDAEYQDEVIRPENKQKNKVINFSLIYILNRFNDE